MKDVIIILFVMFWFGIWIFAWVYGSQKRIVALVFLAAFCTLFILGLIIAAIQTMNWKISKSNNIQAQFVEMQKQKLEIEKLALEREKLSKKKKDKSKDK